MKVHGYLHPQYRASLRWEEKKIHLALKTRPRRATYQLHRSAYQRTHIQQPSSPLTVCLLIALNQTTILRG